MNQSEKATFSALALFTAVVVTMGATPRAPGRPKKPQTAAVPLSLGDLVTVNGQTYQLQLAPALKLVSPAPSPTPTPTPKPALTGIRNRLTGLLVTAARAGDPLSLEGTLLGTSAGRIQLAGRIVPTPTNWTATSIQFLAPDPGPVPVTGSWDVFQPSGNAWALIASSGAFTLLPATSPLPTPTPTAMPLMVTGFRDAMGRLAQSFAPGQTIFIQGQGFGTTPGKVQIGSLPTPVLSWTPTEIQVRCPPGQGPQMLTVTSADGKQWDRLKAFSISRAGVKR